MSFTFAGSGAILIKAGVGVSTKIPASGAFLQEISNEVEAYINTRSRRDWIGTNGATFTALPANTKNILAEAASNLAAIYCISYDMGGYTSRGEAESMVNILRDAAERDIQLLKEEKEKDFISSG